MLKRRCLLLAAIVCFFLDSSFAQMAVEDELYAFVLGVEGKPNNERGEFIRYQLKKMGASFFTASFDTFSVRANDTVKLGGENIVARLGRGPKRIVVGAHYDAVPGSPGANDNGGGVAVVLELVKTLKSLDWNYGVDFCFFDQEEVGLIGSTFYTRQFVDPKNHLAMINLDVEGTGEEVFVGPVGGGDDDMVMPIVRQAAKKTKFLYVENAVYPGSDHESFAAAKLENISISIVPKGDAEKLVDMVKNGWKAGPKGMPKVMRVMHTPDDRSDQMTPDALKMSYEFTKTVLLLLNEAGK